MAEMDDFEKARLVVSEVKDGAISKPEACGNDVAVKGLLGSIQLETDNLEEASAEISKLFEESIRRSMESL